MQTGNEQKTIPQIDEQNLKAVAPGVDSSVVAKLVTLLNERISSRKAPLYIFVNPDLPRYAEEIKSDVSETLKAFLYLSSFYPNCLKMRVILDHDDLFYHLQDEDLTELKECDTVHNPYDPMIVYNDAKSIVRHAFVLGLNEKRT